MIQRKVGGDRREAGKATKNLLTQMKAVLGLSPELFVEQIAFIYILSAAPYTEYGS